MNLTLPKRKLTLVLMLVLAGVFNSFAQFEGDTATVVVMQDNFVSEKEPDTNFNGTTDMGVAIDNANGDGRETYVTFDITGLYGFGKIDVAYLNIMAAVKGDGGWTPVDEFTINVYGLSEPWSEATVTWETKPTSEVEILAQEIIGLTATRHFIDGTETDNTTIAKYIQKAIDEEKQTISFAIKGAEDTDNNRVWISDKGWEGAKLEVSFIPEIIGVYVEKINVSGADNATAITTDNGTLQMSAEVLPVNADNKVVQWSVENGTGKATISKTGLLTAMSNGKVTVKADAVDGSWTQGTMEVTISGQIIAVGELSIIKDGFFAVDGANHPEWSGNATIVDGIAVCDPPAGGTNPWDWTMTQIVNVPYEEKDVPFVFSFKAWADEVRTFNVDFEDANNNYSRYGVSPEGINNTSDWTFDVTTEPTTYVFNVTFSNMAENARQSLQFMLGKADAVVYIDSVMLTRKSDIILSSKDLQVNSIKVYPNPVGNGNTLFVDLSAVNAKVAVYNSVGQKLMEKTADGNRVSFNVSGLPKGMYFIKTEDGSSQKFIR